MPPTAEVAVVPLHPGDEAVGLDGAQDSSRLGIRVVTIYGIRNCETMKKARAWLDEHAVAYEFHDYKVSGIARPMLENWARSVGWERLLNRAGTTFRKLPEKDREGMNEGRAMALMLAQPSMIKRPVLDVGGLLIVGFKPEDYDRAFAGRR